MAKSYVSRAEGMRSVRLDLEEADHADLRILAAAADQPMSQFARGIVLAHIRTAQKAGAIPRKKTRKNPE